MKKITSVIFLLSVYIQVNAQVFSWANKYDFSDYNLGLSISLDAAGNSYIGGHYFNYPVPGPVTPNPSGAYIAKFNATGDIVWSDTVNGSDDYWEKVNVDPSGNVYLGTFVSGTRTLAGGTTVTSSGAKDALIAKYSSSGTLLWAKTAGWTGNDVIQGIGTDASGNVYIAGYYSGMAMFDGIMLMGDGQTDIFVAKYSPTGTALWAQSAGGSADNVTGNGFDQALDLSVDNNGNVYITGYFLSSAAFGATTLTGTATRDAFVAKLSTSGGWIWATKIGSGASAVAVSADNSGNSYVSGSFSGTSMFGSTSLTSAGSVDAYLAKLNSSGAVSWVRKAGGTDTDVTYDVSLDALGNPHVIGSFRGNMSIGDTAFTLSGQENTFIAKYDAAGNFDWAKQISGIAATNDVVTGYGIDIDASGNVFSTGEIFEAALFDAITVTSSKSSEAFVAKLASNVSAGVNEIADSRLNCRIFYTGDHTIEMVYETDRPAEIQLQVMNVSGQCVYSENNVQLNGKGNRRITLPRTAQGIYFVNVISKEKRSAFKFVID